MKILFCSHSWLKSSSKGKKLLTHREVFTELHFDIGPSTE